MTDDLSWFDTEDGRLAYRELGTGHPLVLLHGGFLDHHMWDGQIPVLASRYRVIAPDARGHGASANARRPFRHTDDLAALLRHLDVGPAVLAGVSMGASTAVDTALEHPDLVRALVVTGAGTSEPEFTDPWTVEALGAATAAMAAGDLEGAIDAFALFAAGPYRTLDDVDPEVLRRVREMARRTMSKHTADEGNLLIPVPETWARAARITAPLLAVNGDLDSPDHIGMAERLAGLVAHGGTATVEGAAHYPSLERPDAYNRILLDFLHRQD
ncbi:alpha/beta fold hydrolase [Actinoallomurus rhizosphaericola]|uniref:alpha/beta fold hydrolase n=1 Tax=Actinoallomurus rhizosphaericola TaxID=2952536 RepID=UPI002092FD09|nr:alpha/beta hydrolase [Actinoallomurus rhizosphaericola]MCO5998906.1 alpha/beta hydrolase [Actinoallomurus rhizosphaericola]